MTRMFASRHVRARSGRGSGAPVTSLHIGARETRVASGTAAAPEATLVLRIGFKQVAADYLRHDPPTPYELESAINRIEDELVRAQPMLAQESTLVTNNPALRAAARLEGAAPGADQAASQEAVERLFQHIAASSEASAWRQQDAWSPQHAATVLILREFMHHLGFAAAQVTG